MLESLDAYLHVGYKSGKCGCIFLFSNRKFYQLMHAGIEHHVLIYTLNKYHISSGKTTLQEHTVIVLMYFNWNNTSLCIILCVHVVIFFSRRQGHGTKPCGCGMPVTASCSMSWVTTVGGYRQFLSPQTVSCWRVSVPTEQSECGMWCRVDARKSWRYYSYSHIN